MSLNRNSLNLTGATGHNTQVINSRNKSHQLSSNSTGGPNATHGIKTLKKSQIDTSIGHGFLSNTMNNFQMRNQSRNNNLSQNNSHGIPTVTGQPILTNGQNTMANNTHLQNLLNQYHEQQEQQQIQQQSPLSKTIKNFMSKNQNVEQQPLSLGRNAKQQHYFTHYPSSGSSTGKNHQLVQSMNNDQLKNELAQINESFKNTGSASNARQHSNRRIANKNNSPSLTQNVMNLMKGNTMNLAGVSNLIHANNILPPMQKTPHSRNANSNSIPYKHSLTEQMNQRLVKGVSPKGHAHPAPAQLPQQSPQSVGQHARLSQSNPRTKSSKLSHQNSNELSTSAEDLNQSNQIAKKFISGNGGQQQQMTPGAARTRNMTNQLGAAQSEIPNAKQQYNSLRPTNNANLQQSPMSNTVNQSRFFSNTRNIPQLSPYSGFQQPTHPSQFLSVEFDPIHQFMQTYEPAKFASKRNGVVVSYAANTHQGIIRNYNEDRVSIILNIIKPKFKETANWPRCSFFGVYDGHGGAACADYLRDQLHQLIVKSPDFPDNPKLAIEQAFQEAERTFLDYAENQAVLETGQIDRSGSCAIITLIVGDMCYVANVGDSRAIMSVDGGEKILLLSRDHKPESDDETKRIEENGGRIYQNTNYIPDMSPQGKGQMQMIVGPHRVFPGRLSVSRTIGDIEAKDPKLGGNPNVVVPTPDIKCFKIRNNYDYIILACDGVFEKMTNQDVTNAVWSASTLSPEELSIAATNNGHIPTTIHEKCGISVDKILHESAVKRTFDNITAVMIAFENFENIAGHAVNEEEKVSLGQKPTVNQIFTSDQNNGAQLRMRKMNPVEEELIENQDEILAPQNLNQVFAQSAEKTNDDGNLQQQDKIMRKKSTDLSKTNHTDSHGLINSKQRRSSASSANKPSSASRYPVNSQQYLTQQNQSQPLATNNQDPQRKSLQLNSTKATTHQQLSFTQQSQGPIQSQLYSTLNQNQINLSLIKDNKTKDLKKKSSRNESLNKNPIHALNTHQQQPIRGNSRGNLKRNDHNQTDQHLDQSPNLQMQKQKSIPRGDKKWYSHTQQLTGISTLHK